MKISNFRPVPGQPGFAQVDVATTTSFLWWKRTITRTTYVAKHYSYWRFMDTGRFTPDLTVERLEQIHQAQQQLNACLNQCPRPATTIDTAYGHIEVAPLPAGEVFLAIDDDETRASTRLSPAQRAALIAALSPDP